MEIMPLLGGPGRWRFGLYDLPAVDLHLFRLRLGRLRGPIRTMNKGMRLCDKVPHILNGPLKIGIF